MTYPYYPSTAFQYDFTALSIEDLQAAGLADTANCGDTITMPATASICVPVKDSDKLLSGDPYWDETVREQSYQTATISLGEEGSEIGNGRQIYLKNHLGVTGAKGNRSLLIEIEQEGSSEKYYTLHDDRGVPAAGIDLPLGNKGDWIGYRDLRAGPCDPPKGSISGTVFCDTDCDGINGETTAVPDHAYTVDAENLWDFDFSTFYSFTASGGKAVMLECAGGYMELATCIPEKSGTYDIKIAIQDEIDGQSVIKLFVGRESVDAVRVDTDGLGIGNGHYSTYIIDDVALSAKHLVTVRAYGDDGKVVRIDKIGFEGADGEVFIPKPAKAGIKINLLDANGSVVATTQTEAGGSYSFEGVPTGNYRIKGVASDDSAPTVKDVLNDTRDGVDSDVDGNGLLDAIMVGLNGTVDIDLGVWNKIDAGALSGCYFCDENGNDLDNSEPETLLGAYRSDGFGSGDVIDDASGRTALVTVTGNETENIDPGVGAANIGLSDTPDSAKGCANELISLDLNDNISGSDGATPVVAMVAGQAIAQGGSVTSSAGSIATFNAGVLQVDGRNAFSALGIGEQEAIASANASFACFGAACPPPVHVPEISALEGTAAIAAVLAMVVLIWERRRRQA